MSEAVKALGQLSEDPEAARIARRREEMAFFARMREELRREEERKAIERAAEQGIERGREKARRDLRRKIIEFCGRFGIELSPSRLEELEAADADLERVLDAVVLERRWPG